ncbi:hypothetical protein BDZ91DRAFT_720560, partial [Kalaharituber pfeilii]
MYTFRSFMLFHHKTRFDRRRQSWVNLNPSGRLPSPIRGAENQARNKWHPDHRNAKEQEEGEEASTRMEGVEGKSSTEKANQTKADPSPVHHNCGADLEVPILSSNHHQNSINSPGFFGGGKSLSCLGSVGRPWTRKYNRITPLLRGYPEGMKC